MRYRNEPVHEGYELLTPRPLGELRAAIWQFPFRNLDESIRKMNRYSSLGAAKLADRRVSMAGALAHGGWAFIKHYIFKRGYRRRLGRFRDRVRKFRRHVLPLRQTLRADAELVPTAERASAQALAASGVSRISHRSCGLPIARHSGAAGGP